MKKVNIKNSDKPPPRTPFYKRVFTFIKDKSSIESLQNLLNSNVPRYVLVFVLILNILLWTRVFEEDYLNLATRKNIGISLEEQSVAAEVEVDKENSEIENLKKLIDVLKKKNRDLQISNEEFVNRVKGIEDYILKNSDFEFTKSKYIVEDGDTLESISREKVRSLDALEWANDLGTHSPLIKSGDILNIPEVDGFFYVWSPGRPLSDVVEETGGNVKDIKKYNYIEKETFSSDVTWQIFIPYNRTECSSNEVDLPAMICSNLLEIILANFVRPLPDNCGELGNGYTYYHRGIDLVQPEGCWINASAEGNVVHADWKKEGQGFMVEIDHGGGVRTRYYHGNGDYKVKQGDRVTAGQGIMYMGDSGRTYGTHLHFELVLNGVRVNPESYGVPLR